MVRPPEKLLTTPARRFLDLEPERAEYLSARAAILPVPFERTTSWGVGTARGPAALLEASTHLELWDEELRCEPADVGIATLQRIAPSGRGAEALAQIEAACRPHLESGKFLAVLGGEHALTLAPVRAVRDAVGEIGVVQFDAHADLRESYEGSPYSHASVMRRIVEEGLPTLAVGLRSLSTPEARFIDEQRLPVIWGRELDDAEARFRELVEELPPRIYLTFDVDFLDPSILPSTGTPEPGGGLWYPTLRLLRHLFRAREVVAMDLVELSPVSGRPASDFTAAKLLYKCLGYRFCDPGSVAS